MKKLKFLIIVFLISFQAAHADRMLRIVGSSAVFPFAATVAEHFSYKTHEPIPLIEAVGSGAGVKLFCSDIHGPDGVISSRPLSPKEKQTCGKNGVTFAQFIIGKDGLVLIQRADTKSFSVTLHDLDQALSEKTQKNCIKNPHKVWKDIQPQFPDRPIRVLGPAPNSGTYDILVEKLGSACSPTLRHDGAYIEAAANENLIIQKVVNAPGTIGIVTYSFYDQNRTHLKAMPVNDVLPSLTTIQGGTYLLSRPLYLYVKTNDLGGHPARSAYALEFTSSEAIGENGYLTAKGLIPLSVNEQKMMHEKAEGVPD